MQNELKIQSAGPEDVDQIILIWQELMQFHAERDPLFRTRPDAKETFEMFIRSNIKNENWLVAEAVVNGRVVGYCQCSIEEYPPIFELRRHGQINDLVILPAYRRQGIGERLVKRALDWFGGKGLERVEVRFSVYNEVANPFWKTMGFEPYLSVGYQSICREEHYENQGSCSLCPG
jgi:GNAT superfamily N-acetyltransferase